MLFKFNVMNSVKQGEVLSPILFPLYTDDVLERIEDTRVSCHMGSCITLWRLFTPMALLS